MDVNVYVCVLGVVGILVYVSRSEREYKTADKRNIFGHLLKKTPKTLDSPNRPNHDPDEDNVQIQE